VEVTQRISAPPATVFSYLTESEKFAAWWASVQSSIQDQVGLNASTWTESTWQ
jgi:uncharacterized protein YndB with AHSA1/START domain